MKSKIKSCAFLCCLALASSAAIVENYALQVTLDESNGAFSVVAKKCGRLWSQIADPALAYSVSDVTAVSRYALSFTLRVPKFDSPLKCELSLDGENVCVSLDADHATPMSVPIRYPYPFAGVRGDRILLTQGNGFAFPVEMVDLGTDKLDRTNYPGRDMEMGCWGQFSETNAPSGEVLPAAGCLAIIDTPENSGLDYSVRFNGFRQANVRWSADRGTFGHGRRIRFAFARGYGPMQMARRYRREMKKKGYLVTLREKKRIFPRIAKKIDLLVGAPDVWYWAIDGDKPAMARRLKELGFDNFMFCYATRKDLGTWIERADVQEIAKIPGVVQCEYDIYRDTMERANLPLIEYVRPYWCVDAADNDDLVFDRFGKPARGWRVALKGDGDGKGKGLGCAAICEARAPFYAKRRIGEQLKTWPYDARMLDVTGGSLGECWNPKHPLNKRESAKARRELFAMVQRDLGLIAGTEDGGEWCVPACCYFEGTMSAPNHYRVDGGRYMWKVYDEVPDKVARGTDETTRVPFWEMVFHGCVVTYWYWCDYNNKFPSIWWKRDLFNAVTGTPPMYLFTPETFPGIQDRLAASVKTATEVAKATGFSSMSDYRWLTGDRKVQQSRFSNGVVCTVNFGDSPYAMPDGSVLPPRSHRMERVQKP